MINFEKISKFIDIKNIGNIILPIKRRFQLSIYSLDDRLLSLINNVDNWELNEISSEKLIIKINKLQKIIDDQKSIRINLGNLSSSINNPSVDSIRKSQLKNKLEEEKKKLISDSDYKNIENQIQNLKNGRFVVQPDVHYNFRNNGFYSGVFKYKYQLIRDWVENCVLLEINSDRTEIKFKLKNVDANNVNQFSSFMRTNTYLQDPVIDNFFIEPKINFYEDEQFSILNWLTIDGINGLIKLQESLPDGIEVDSLFRIIIPLSDPIEDKIILHPSNEELNVNILKSANYNIKTSFKKEKMNLSSYNDIVSKGYDISKLITNKYFQTSSEGIELNVDYRNFDNFVFYSSALERLKNFKYKLQLIEGYVSSSTNLQSEITGSATSSLEYINTYNKYRIKKDDVIKSFDNYEYYLYYESSSYVSNSFGEFFPTTWPKSNNSKPYTLYSVTSSQAVDWYDGAYDSASSYDNNNYNSLVRTIPEYIREDEYSDNFIKFVNLCAQQLDILWLYTKEIDNLKNRDEDLKTGMSKDLIYHVLNSYGWDGVNDMQFDDLWYYAFGTDISGSNILTGSLAVSQSIDWVNVVSESISSGDIQKELWKRILNNLSYLNKNKGTKEGIRALINCFGIPSTELDIKEFGGPEQIDASSYFEYRKFTYALQFQSESYIRTPYPVDSGSIEFRFKTNYSGSQTIFSDLSHSFKIGIDSEGSMSIDRDSDLHPITSIPVNDNQWWSFLMTDDKEGSGNTYDIYLKKMTYGRISHQYSASINISGSSPIFGTDDYQIGGDFTGSLQEFRYWNTYLSENSFNNHVTAPTSYNGNTETSSYDNLYFRLTLGTDTQRYNHYLTSSLNSQHPNNHLIYSGTFVGFDNDYNYEPIEETWYQKWPDISGNRTISNKVRVETNYITGSLQFDSRIEQSSFDKYPLDSPKVGVYLSPTNEVNQDIAEYMGGFNIDDIIGSWSDEYNNYYSGLTKYRNYYFKQYTGKFNTTDYFRLLDYYNTSLFKQIKEVLPAHAKPLTGLVIEPHILNRNKVSILKRRPSAEKPLKEAELDLINSYLSISGERNLYEASLNNIHNTGSMYNWYDIIFVNGSPRQVNNDIAFREGLQTMYEDQRSNIDYKYTLSIGMKKQRYYGTKMTSPDFNVTSPDTPDHKPVVEFNEDKDLSLVSTGRGQNKTGYLDIE